MKTQVRLSGPSTESERSLLAGWSGWIKRQMLPNVGTLLLVVLLISSAKVWAKPLLRSATAPGPGASTINYQGRLADAAGTPLDGTYAMIFGLWDSPTDGSLVWGPEQHIAVPVSDGLFNVGLGSLTAGGIPASTWGGDRFLEVTIDGETLSPREAVRSVPIAGLALSVPDGSIGSRSLSPTVFASYSSGEVAISDLGSPTEALSLTVDFPLDGTYLIFVQVAGRHDQSGPILSYLEDEGGAPIVGSNIYTQTPAGGTQSGTTNVVHSFSAGAHTIRLFAGVIDAAGSGAITSSHIIAIPFSQ